MLVLLEIGVIEAGLFGIVSVEAAGWGLAVEDDELLRIVLHLIVYLYFEGKVGSHTHGVSMVDEHHLLFSFVYLRGEGEFLFHDWLVEIFWIDIILFTFSTFWLVNEVFKFRELFCFIDL